LPIRSADIHLISNHKNLCGECNHSARIDGEVTCETTVEGRSVQPEKVDIPIGKVSSLRRTAGESAGN
jgi:hypothetical protein